MSKLIYVMFTRVNGLRNSIVRRKIMARPTTKNELLNAANYEYDRLCKLVDRMDDGQQVIPFCFEVTEKDKEAHWARDKNIRDVFIHLYEWHQLVINWVNANRKNEEVVPFLPEPYTWRNYGGMNIAFLEKHQTTTYEESKQMLSESHKKVIDLIESFSNDELFTKAYFKWSGTTSVGSYLVSATSSHYNWAIKKIKRQIKALK